MTPGEFNALFDHITRSAFRYEGLDVYDVGEEQEDLHAWQAGEAVAERSVRTDPWLARIADQTINRSIDWCRVRRARYPLSWYVAWEVGDGYLESQAVGERILLTDETLWDGPDFWLFDEDTVTAHAVLLHYDSAGAPTGYELVTDASRLSRMIEAARRMREIAQPLNEWIAAHRGELRGAGVQV